MKTDSIAASQCDSAGWSASNRADGRGGSGGDEEDEDRDDDGGAGKGEGGDVEDAEVVVVDSSGDGLSRFVVGEGVAPSFGGSSIDSTSAMLRCCNVRLTGQQSLALYNHCGATVLRRTVTETRCASCIRRRV